MRTGAKIRADRAAAKPKTAKPVGRIISYGKSRRRWIDAGKPVRDQAAIEEILNTKCKPCIHYIKQTENSGRCKLCTCQLNLNRTLNKIYWATEGCPDDEPKWTPDVTEEQIAENRNIMRVRQREEIRARLSRKRKDLSGR